MIIGDGLESARDGLREARALLNRTPRCSLCKRRTPTVVETRGGNRVAICASCAGTPDSGREPSRSRLASRAAPDARDAARRRQRAAEAAFPRYAPAGRSATISDSELAGILRQLADELDLSDSAKVWQLIAESGINADDFKYMIQQLGVELD